MVSAIENWAYIEGRVQAVGPVETPGYSGVEIVIRSVSDYEEMPNLMASRVGDRVVVRFDESKMPDTFAPGDDCRLRVKVVGPNRIIAHASDHTHIESSTGPGGDADTADTSVRPLLLLGVDGVLNPETATAPTGFTPIKPTDASRSFLFSRSHRRWLIELAERFDVVWVSVWQDAANDVLAEHYGMPRRPVISFDAVREYVADRPVVWVMEAPAEQGRSWADERDSPTLLIEPDRSVGLTEHHVRAIRQFYIDLGA